MSGLERRRAAGVLLIVTSVIWLHEWMPALFVAAFVVWAVVHHRLEGEFGDGLLRWWRRVWPPPAVVLVPLLLAGTLGYSLSTVSTRGKILPVTLNVIALSLVVLGGWWRRARHQRAGDFLEHNRSAALRLLESREPA
ncbi:MAG: hypothetical protein HYU41_08660 [Candidatus Rokubacteria bacterium]|nr:hypothetical protein [Candidatus Rokubacteria bacterium]